MRHIVLLIFTLCLISLRSLNGQMHNSPLANETLVDTIPFDLEEPLFLDDDLDLGEPPLIDNQGLGESPKVPQYNLPNLANSAEVGKTSLPFFYRYRKDANTFRLLLERGISSRKQENYEYSLKLLKILEKNATIVGDNKKILESVYEQAIIQINKQNIQNAKKLINTGIEKSQDFNQIEHEARLLVLLGILKYANNEAYFEPFDRALEICLDPIDNSEECKTVFTFMAEFSSQTDGDYNKSIKFRKYALNEISKIGDFNSDFSNLSELIKEYHLIGIMDSIDVTFSRMLSLMSNASESTQSNVSNQLSYAYGLNAYGSFLCETWVEEGLKYIKEALRIAEIHNDSEIATEALTQLVYFGYKNGEYQKALNYAEKFRNEYDGLSNNAWLYFTKKEESLIKLKREDEAVQLLREGLAFYDSLNDNDHIHLLATRLSCLFTENYDNPNINWEAESWFPYVLETIHNFNPGYQQMKCLEECYLIHTKSEDKSQFHEEFRKQKHSVFKSFELRSIFSFWHQRTLLQNTSKPDEAEALLDSMGQYIFEYEQKLLEKENYAFKIQFNPPSISKNPIRITKQTLPSSIVPASFLDFQHKPLDSLNFEEMFFFEACNHYYSSKNNLSKTTEFLIKYVDCLIYQNRNELAYKMILDYFGNNTGAILYNNPSFFQENFHHFFKERILELHKLDRHLTNDESKVNVILFLMSISGMMKDFQEILFLYENILKDVRSSEELRKILGVKELLFAAYLQSEDFEKARFWSKGDFFDDKDVDLDSEMFDAIRVFMNALRLYALAEEETNKEAEHLIANDLLKIDWKRIEQEKFEIPIELRSQIPAMKFGVFGMVVDMERFSEADKFFLSNINNPSKLHQKLSQEISSSEFSQIYFSIASHFEETKNYDRAKFYYLLSLEVSSTINEKLEVTRSIFRTLRMARDWEGILMHAQKPENEKLTNTTFNINSFKTLDGYRKILNDKIDIFWIIFEANYFKGNFANSFIKAKDDLYEIIEIVEKLPEEANQLGESSFSEPIVLMMNVWKKNEEEIRKQATFVEREKQEKLAEIERKDFFRILSERNEETAVTEREKKIEFQNLSIERDTAYQREKRARAAADKANTELDLANSELESRNYWLLVTAVILGILLMFIGLLLMMLYNNYNKLQETYKSLQKAKDTIENQRTEIYHRVKRNLKNLKEIIEIQAKEYEGEIFSALQNTKKVVERYSRIHLNLYNHGDPKNIPVEEYFELLQKDLIKVNYEKTGFVTVTPNISENLKMESVQLVPLALSFYELFSNSCEHAFKGLKRRRKIYYAVEEDNGKIKFRYGDNGIGMDKHLQNGKDGHLGMKIINYQIETALGGTINFDSKRENGFEVSTIF